MNPDLSDREIQVLSRVSYGHTFAQIGRALCIAEGTVKTHVRRMFEKFEVHDRAALVRAGFERGYLRLPQPESPAPVSPVAMDWVAAEMARPASVVGDRPLSDRHIGACFAARACPCREGSTWRFPEEAVS